MKVISIALAMCATLLHTAAGAPVEAASSRPLQARAQAWFDAYSEAGFKGKYLRYNADFGKCVSIAADFPPSTPGGLTSVKVGPENSVSCAIYSNPDCNAGTKGDLGGDTLGIYSLHSDLSDPEISWGDRAQTFKCEAR